MLIDYGIIGAVGLLIYSVVDAIISPTIGRRISCNDEKVLTVGYEKGLFRKPITIDMNIDSHVLIIGLSNCGKSKLAEGMLKGKSVTIFTDYFDYARANDAKQRIMTCIEQGPYPCKVKE